MGQQIKPREKQMIYNIISAETARKKAQKAVVANLAKINDRINWHLQVIYNCIFATSEEGKFVFEYTLLNSSSDILDTETEYRKQVFEGIQKDLTAKGYIVRELNKDPIFNGPVFSCYKTPDSFKYKDMEISWR